MIFNKEPKPKKETTMPERLGNVLYWASLIGALVSAYYGFKEGQKLDSGEDLIFLIIMAAIFAFPFYLVGRAVRYVLSDR